ncbi:MAG: hypothetical protein AAFZ65_10985, partial [Planctomycetota bacterium]
MIDRLLATLRGHGPRPSVGGEPTDAWVGAVAAALAVVERERAVGESHDLWRGEAYEPGASRPKGARRPAEGSALRLDLAFLERQILTAVMELPERDRNLVLGRYRDGRSMEQLARDGGTRRRAIVQRLRAVLTGIGDHVRDACGGSASVYAAALAAVAERRASGQRTGSWGSKLGPWNSGSWNLGSWAAAAAVLIAVGWAFLPGVDRASSDTPARTVVAGERSELGGARGATSASGSNASTPEMAELELPTAAAALEAEEVAALVDLQGRVTLLGTPPGDDYLGQARAACQGVEHVQLVDGDGRFSFAALTAGTWRITL